jgi:hypothetical protein
MKKLVLFGLIFLLSITNLFAENPITVISGDISILKIKSLAFLEVDYSETKIGDQTLEEYLISRGDKNWTRDNELAIPFFSTWMKRKSKGIKMTENMTEASYKIIIHVKMLDLGFGGGAFVPLTVKLGGCVLYGTIDIIDLKTNETVCILDVNNLKGDKHNLQTVRLGYMYRTIADYLCKLK